MHRSKNIAQIQREFQKALIDPYKKPPIDTTHKGGLSLEKRFAVYRNNVFLAIIECLKSVYNTTAKMLGEEDFLALSQNFVRQHPPKSPIMLLYGEQFTGFLRKKENIHPLIIDMTKTEWKIRTAMTEKDAKTTYVQQLQKIEAQKQQHIILKPHPALKTAKSKWNLLKYQHDTKYDEKFWQELKPKTKSDYKFVITRPKFEVIHFAVDDWDYHFLQNLIKNYTIGEAYEKTCELYPNFSLINTLSLLINKGCFCSMNLADGL